MITAVKQWWKRVVESWKATADESGVGQHGRFTVRPLPTTPKPKGRPHGQGVR